MEEVLERSREQDHQEDAAWGSGVLLVVSKGPPWYDDITQEPLDPEEVERGMQRERDCYADFDAVEPTTWEEAGEEAKPIPMRWVLRLKPTAENPKAVRARLCAQQLAIGPADAFAATPSSVGPRLAVAWAGLRPGWVLHVLDITTAFLHARVPEGERVYLQPH